MRLFLLLSLGCACSFRGSATLDASEGGPDSTTDAPPSELDAATDSAPDAQPDQLVWTETTQTDFGAGTFAGSFASSWNTVEPVPFINGWVVQGVAGSLFSNENDTNFATLTGATDRVLINNEDFALSAGQPRWVRNVNDPFTVWSTGEIFLAAGVTNFRMACDDVGFVEIALPGADFSKVVTCKFNAGTRAANFTVADAGWYPIRIAWADAGAGSNFSLTAKHASEVNHTRIPVRAMRTKDAATIGAWQIGYDELNLGEPQHARLTTDSLLTANFGAAPPPLLGLNNGTWASRWQGQLRLESSGDYAFFLDSFGGHRFTIDGRRVVNTALDTAAQTTTAPVTLAAGWHEVAIDLMVNNNTNMDPARMAFKVASGPELADQLIPGERLRPIIGGSQRIVSGLQDADETSSFGGDLLETVSINSIPDDAIVTGIDIAYRTRLGFGGSMDAALVSPNNTEVAAGNGGDATVFRSFTDFNDQPARGDWKLKMTNTSNSRLFFTSFAITVHYKTSQRPAIEQLATFTSKVHDFGKDVIAKQVAWTTRQATADTLKTEVRLCAQSCNNEPFVAVTNGQDDLQLTGRYAQYRVTFASDGSVVPALADMTVRATAMP